MANSFFNVSGVPGTRTPGSSATMRTELAAIAAGFDKMPVLAGNALKPTRINAGATALEATDTLALTLLTIALGSAAAPSLAITGDLDTGLYSAGANNINLATAGLARFGINATGNHTIAAPTTGVALSVESFAGSDGIQVSGALVGSAVQIAARNTDAANAASNAQLVLSVNGASAGDPIVVHNINGVLNWSAGPDNSDSDKFKISTSFGSVEMFALDTAGRLVLTPSATSNSVLAFSAVHAASGAGARVFAATDTRPGGVYTPRHVLELTAEGTVGQSYGQRAALSIGAVSVGTAASVGTLAFSFLSQFDAYVAETAKLVTLLGTGELLIGRQSSNAALFLLQVGDGTASGRSRFNSNDPYSVGAANGVSGSSYYFGASSTASPDGVFSNNAGTARFTMTDDGRFYGSALHNNAGSMTGAVNQGVGSGTFTPTLTNVANSPTLGPKVCQWIRVGNVVTVSGGLDSTATAAGGTVTQIGISLPIASALTLAEQLGGAGADNGLTSAAGVIYGDAANDRANYVYKASTTAGPITHFFSFTYVVL